MDNSNSGYNNEYIESYKQAFGNLCRDMRLGYINRELSKFMVDFNYNIENVNNGIYRDGNLSAIKVMEGRLFDKIRKLLSAPVQDWFNLRNADVNAEIFNVINSNNPNRINSIEQCFDKLSASTILTDVKEEEFNKFIKDELETVLEPYEFTMDNAKLEEIKTKFTSNASEMYKRKANEISSKLDEQKRNFVANQRSLMIKHINEENQEEKNKAVATDQRANSEMENVALENKQDKEMFGLSTIDVISKVSGVASLFNLQITKDDNGKVRVYGIDNKEASTDYIEDEELPRLLINFEDVDKYSLVIKGDEKDIIQISKGDISIKYFSTINKYHINSTNYEYAIDVNNNTITKKDKNELVESPIDATYEEVRDDLLSVGIDISKIDGLNKEISQR